MLWKRVNCLAVVEPKSKLDGPVACTKFEIWEEPLSGPVSMDSEWLGISRSSFGVSVRNILDGNDVIDVVAADNVDHGEGTLVF